MSMNFNRIMQTDNISSLGEKKYCVPVSTSPLQKLESNERQGQKLEFKDFSFLLKQKRLQNVQ